MIMNILDDLSSELHETAVSKGFWGPPEQMDKYMAKLMLVTSELAEILEALRKGKGPEKVAEEFADAQIRLMDLWRALKNDGVIPKEIMLDAALLGKAAVNIGRPALHGHVWG